MAGLLTCRSWLIGLYMIDLSAGESQPKKKKGNLDSLCKNLALYKGEHFLGICI